MTAAALAHEGEEEETEKILHVRDRRSRSLRVMRGAVAELWLTGEP